jgi:hypothetical protein
VDDGGYPPRKGGPFGRTGEDYNERPLSLQPFGGINNYILAGMLSVLASLSDDPPDLRTYVRCVALL